MTNPTNPDEIVRQAAEIKLKIKALEEEYEMIQPLVMARIKELSQDKDKYALEIIGVGTFSIIKKPKWEYSPALRATEAQLKEDKKTEEADGTATIVNYIEYPSFRAMEKKE